MTRIEGEPLLVEDLEGRRKELLSDVRTILEKSDGWLKGDQGSSLSAVFVNQVSVAADLEARGVEGAAGAGATGVQGSHHATDD